MNKEKAVRLLRKKYEMCCDLFHGFDWRTSLPSERLTLLPAALEHVLAQKEGKLRCLKIVGDLTKAFALAVPHEETTRIRDDVAFFQAVRAALAKRAASRGRSDEELDYAVRQIVSQAVVPEGIRDIFAAAGLQKPDVSILSDEFLMEVRDMGRANLAVELLQRLLKSEIATRRNRNVVQARSFAELLQEAIERYESRAMDTAQIIEELIKLAREMRKANKRGEDLGLTEDELAFYDALETNDSAVKILGDQKLCGIARDLVGIVRNNAVIDWIIREDKRANIRRLVRRTLRKNDYPPDKREKAVRTVLEQAELFSANRAGALQRTE